MAKLKVFLGTLLVFKTSLFSSDGLVATGSDVSTSSAYGNQWWSILASLGICDAREYTTLKSSPDGYVQKNTSDGNASDQKPSPGSVDGEEGKGTPAGAFMP